VRNAYKRYAKKTCTSLAVELSLTNFDAKHLEEIENSGFSIATNQIQYSILDQRPKQLMKQVCEEHSVKILAYGTLCKYS